VVTRYTYLDIDVYHGVNKTDLPHDVYMYIGSTETEWGIPAAGQIWADCLLNHLKIRRNVEDISSSISECNAGVEGKRSCSYIYTYIYMYIFMYVCACLCVFE
jgi:hypothetical protein